MHRLLLFFVLFHITSLVAASEDNRSKANFEQKMFALQSLSHFGIDETRFQSYTNNQKRDLLEARSILFSFLKATQNPDDDLLSLLGQGLRTAYESRAELLNKLLGQEIEIQSTAITEFELQQDGAIVFSYYVVLFSEGNLLLKEDSASLKKYGTSWKITSIGGLK